MKERPIKDVIVETTVVPDGKLHQAFWSDVNRHNPQTLVRCMKELRSMPDTGGSREQYVDDMLEVANRHYRGMKVPHYIRVYMQVQVNARPSQLSLFK